MTVRDGGDRGGEDDAVDVGIAGGAQDAEGTFDGGADEFVFVLGDLYGKGRGDVEDVFAAFDGFGPACIGHEIGCDEGEAVPCFGTAVRNHGADAGFTRDGADRGADAVARMEKLHDAMGADEAGAAGDQNQILTHGCECTPDRTFALVLFASRLPH